MFYFLAERKYWRWPGFCLSFLVFILAFVINAIIQVIGFLGAILFLLAFYCTTWR